MHLFVPLLTFEVLTIAVIFTVAPPPHTKLCIAIAPKLCHRYVVSERRQQKRVSSRHESDLTSEIALTTTAVPVISAPTTPNLVLQQPLEG